MDKIESIEQLESIYPPVVERALWKEIDHINDHYRQFIEKAPFLLLATRGEHGIDCSPRGDPAGFVRVVGQTQLLIPDRRGNNRLDSLRNIVANPEVGIIFLIPGVGETLRVSGEAELLIDSELPTAGEMAAYFSRLHGLEFDAREYDDNYPEHLKKTIY